MREPESSINFEFSRTFSHRNVRQCARKWDWGHLNSWFSLSFSREGLGSSFPFQFKGRAHCVFTLTFTLSFLPLHDFRWVILRCDLNFYLFLCVLIVSLFNPQHLHRCFQEGEKSESCMTDHSLLHFWCPTFPVRIFWFKIQESFLQCICKEQMTEGKKGRVREGVSWKWCSSFTGEKSGRNHFFILPSLIEAHSSFPFSPYCTKCRGFSSFAFPYPVPFLPALCVSPWSSQGREMFRSLFLWGSFPHLP